MQSKSTIAIVHEMAGMRGLYVCYLEHRRWTHVEIIIVNATSGVNMRLCGDVESQLITASVSGCVRCME